MVNPQGCSSSGSSSYSPPPAVARNRGAADRMVKIELEAAEALADLAHLAAQTGGDAAGKWGSKGKRAVKRVKGESPPAIDGGFYSAPPKCLTDHSEDQPVVYLNEFNDLRRNETVKPTKSEQKARSRRPCSTNHSSFGGGRSRQNLTEAEREERKIRRILANRESARQTIRRRQAVYEELAKKAADLSLESEQLKKEKELALKEYRSLETTNRDLKAQVAKVTKAEIEVVEENQGEDVSGQGDRPTSPKNRPFLYDRPPLTPLFWPAMVQSSNPFQSQQEPHNPPIPSSTVSMPTASKPEENHVNMSGPVTPIYLLPCPWFFPFPEHVHGHHPQPFFCVNNKQEGTSVSNRSSACASSKHIANLELNNPTFLVNAKVEDSGSMEAGPVNDLNETMFGYSQNGGDSNKRAHSKDTFLSLAPASCCSVQPIFADSRAELEAISSTASQSLLSLPEQKQERDMHLSLKSMEAFAAAEARKRRKELTKLKNIHIRQSRMYGGDSF